MNRRPDGRWEKTKKIGGKIVHFYSMEPTQRKAERDIERQMIEYSTAETEKKTESLKFKAVTEEWERQKREEVTETTWIKSYSSLTKEITEMFGEYPITDITPEMVLKYFNILKTKKYSMKSVNNRKSILNMIFKLAFVKGLINNNFILNVPTPSGLTKTPRKMPSQAEIDIVKENSTGDDFLFFFLAYTGLRISEACALTNKDFDFENKLITVNKKISWIGNKPKLIHQTKTESGNRQVPLLSTLEKAMPKFKGYLFSRDNGKTPLTKRQLAIWVDNYNKRNGTTITPHQLRHAFASLGVEANLGVKELQYIMGHSDIHTTMDIYAEIRDKQKKEIFKKLDTAKY